MKRVLVIVNTLLLFACMIVSFIFTRNIKLKNNNLSKEIINVNESIIIEKELTKENAETKDSLEKDKTFELDELSIWKKAEEKLEKALN